MLINRPFARVPIAAAVVAASISSAAGSAIDFRQALNIASDAVPSGTAIEIERTVENGVDAIEVEFAFAGGTWLREVTLSAATGSIIEIENFSASPLESAEIATILPLIPASTVDLPDAAARAIAAFEGATVLRTDYEVENGVLIIEALLNVNGSTFEVDINANTGEITGGPNPGGPDVPPTPGDAVISQAIATALAARPALTPVEVYRQIEDGAPAWEVSMLDPATVRVTEVLVNANGTGVLEIENEPLFGSDLVEMQNLSALFPLGLSLNDALAATRARFPNAEILAVEFEAQGGSLRIEALIRENGSTRWVEFNPANPGGGEPGPDAGFAAIALAAIAERPDLTLVEIERDGSSIYDAKLVSASLAEVVELEIARDGIVLDSDPISLGGDAGELAQILSLIGPSTASFVDAANAFTAVYPENDIREIEFDVRGGVLFFEATVLIDGRQREVFIPADSITTPPVTFTSNCAADLTLDGRVDFFDISSFITAFRDQSPLGDWNGDATLNFFDFVTFLSEVNTGCPE